MLRRLPAFVFLVLLAAPAYSETMIGRWCDQPVPTMPRLNQIIEIVLTEQGAFELRSEFGDGSTRVAELEEVSGDLYRDVGGSFGERYRIVSSDGSLQLIDDDGIIRVARRLENAPTAGECF